MMGRTLLLNSTYEPLTVISWKRAVTLSFLGKVEVLRNYDQRIHSVSLVLPMPAVVRLISFIRRKRPRISFSRRNLFARDGYRCQYCARRGDASELTCDHVMPRSRGGTTTWTNMVTCCVACNRKKGGRTPEEAGMRLLSKPVRPETLGGFVLTVNMQSAPETWKDYLSWAKVA